MADVVCLVQSQPDRVSFTWSQGPDAFPPYQLTGQHFDHFREKVEEARRRLSALVSAYLDYLRSPQAEGLAGELSQSCGALAQAGYELRQRVFRPNDDPGRAAKDVAQWLEKLHARGALTSLEVVT